MSTTQTMTHDAPSRDEPASKTPSLRNPKDSMKSTWQTANRSTWKLQHWLFHILDVTPQFLDREVPIHPKTDKVPHIPDWQAHVWILSTTIPAVLLHQAIASYTGRNLGYLNAFLLYAFAFQIIGANQFAQMRRLGHKYGFLDGDKHARDAVPDVAVGKIFLSLILTAFARAAMLVLCSYNPAQTPMQATWWLLPLEAGVYPIVLDFWFYWYHRVMHENDGLWQYHRTHHLTKRPNPLLTLYADEEQEFFDMVGIPILTFACMRWMGFPMSMYGWWFCANYVQYSELAGHSGLRISSTPPSIFANVLRYFQCELAIEDHDLHHRTGWRQSHNYGKQTRVWDRLFGTCIDRIESRPDNIDYENTATIFVGIPWLERVTDGGYA